MSTLVIYHYPKCSTCVQALRWLREHAIAVEPVDITQSPPGVDELRQIAKLAQIAVPKLFNTSGVSYREGGFKDRLKHLSTDEMLRALAADGKLIKRPLIHGRALALVGFSAAAYAAAFTADAP